MTWYFGFFCRYDIMAKVPPKEFYQPSPRYWHASVNTLLGGTRKVVQWGGIDNKYEVIPASNIEVFDGSWESISTLGTPPTATVESASTTIGSNAFTFGGHDGSGTLSNALHSLIAGQWKWSELRALNPEQGPKPKRGSAMVAHGKDVLVVVGGMRDNGYTNEVHCFHLGGGEFRY